MWMALLAQAGQRRSRRMRQPSGCGDQVVDRGAAVRAQECNNERPLRARPRAGCGGLGDRSRRWRFRGTGARFTFLVRFVDTDRGKSGLS